MKHIPNILTILRLILSILVFAALLVIGAGRWPDASLALARFALIGFVVAALTDFFDGWLARRWQVVSLTGAILDPIGDKILVCGTILGLLSIVSLAQVTSARLTLMTGLLAPSAVILFREFAVSALREVLAPRGIKLPVTFVAKTKTTLQLLALGALMVVLLWPAWNLGPTLPPSAMAMAEGLYAVAAVITLWTGLEYGRSAWLALKAPAGVDEA